MLIPFENWIKYKYAIFLVVGKELFFMFFLKNEGDKAAL